MTVARKFVLWSAIAIAGLFVLAVIAGVAIVRTQWFRDQVRDRIVAEVERASGGRTEIGSFQFDWKTLTARVAPFVLHGTEPPGDRPLFRADSVTVGLKIVSVLRRDIDIASLVVDKPQGHAILMADGTTNLPHPKIAWHSNKSFTEQILALAIKKLILRDGLFEFNSLRIPLNLEADRLNVALDYEAVGPRYRGHVQSDRVLLESPRDQPQAFAFDTGVSLEKDRLFVSNGLIANPTSSIEFAGALNHLSSPHGSFQVRARVLPSEISKLARLPIGGTAPVSYTGNMSFQMSPFEYRLDGKLNARGLSYRAGQVRVANAGLDAAVRVTPDECIASDIRFTALGGTFRGNFQLRHLTDFRLDGGISGFQVHDLAVAGERRNLAWNGLVAGPLKVQGSFANGEVRGVTAQAHLDISPASNGIPLSGALDIDYDRKSGLLRLGDSRLNAGSTQAEFSGTLGETLHVVLATRDFNDLTPAFALIGKTAPPKLPAELKNGTAHLDATVNGPLRNPTIDGRLDVSHLALENQTLDSLHADFIATESGLTLKSLTARQGTARMEGSGAVGLHQWIIEDASPITASLALRGATVESLLAIAGRKLPISGALDAKADIHGTFANPAADVHLTADNVTAYNETIDTAKAEIRYSPGTLNLISGRIEAGGAHIDASSRFDHHPNDFRNGHATFEIAGGNIALARIGHVHRARGDIDGQVRLQASGAVRIVNGAVQLESLKSQTTLRNFSVSGERLGDAEIAANTSGDALSVHAGGAIGGTKFQGQGEWTLQGDYPGQCGVNFSRITFADIRRLAARVKGVQQLPFEGFLEGSATVRGPLKKPETMRAELSIPVVRLEANPEMRPRAGASLKDLVLKNDGPVLLEGDAKSIQIKNAKFSAKDTSIEAAGTLALGSSTPWNLTAKGSINLAILQLFNADLLGSGHASLDARVRGTLRDPQVTGRMELHNASLYLNNLPNGIDQANGAIVFDRNRATIERLTAQTGGGQITVGGFVGFTNPVLTYRLFARAQQVRYRTAGGISATADANLSMSGTSESSILSGNVTVTRVGLNPQTDIGSLLAETARPVAAPENPNGYLRGIQLDVRVQNAQSLEIETALTSNVQADADLRIRGNLQRPSVLGTMSVTEGRIEFFGNKYTITRGDVNFYNPTKIEPVIDFDLETQVRGVTVNVSFSGPINKLNLTYRSDPPLDSNQIVALLAVGRSPSLTSGLETTQSAAQDSFVATGTNALLEQAIAAPVSGRLQKFFGVSHLKIDPQMNDLSSIPQARLTLEQQVSRDITLTYITNLARTDEQIVRIEWDLSRQWSVIALRDENGEFGIDFQYRKQFK